MRHCDWRSEKLDLAFGMIEVRALAFSTIKGQGGVEELGSGIRIDATQGTGFTFVEIRNIGSKDPVSDEIIADFFDHFDLWGDG